VPVTGPASAAAARQALADKLHSREKSLAEGSAAVGIEAQRMLAELSPPEVGRRELGDLVILDGEILRKMRGGTVRLLSGQLRALTRDRRYGFARLASGRYVAVHLL